MLGAPWQGSGTVLAAMSCPASPRAALDADPSSSPQPQTRGKGGFVAFALFYCFALLSLFSGSCLNCMITWHLFMPMLKKH